jgi:hypothetical protein
MFPFKFLTTNQNKNNLMNLIFEDYIQDVDSIVNEMIEYEGNPIVTDNGQYYITNVEYGINKVYTRSICYSNEFPNLIIRMSTFPNEVTITVGDRTNDSQHL